MSPSRPHRHKDPETELRLISASYVADYLAYMFKKGLSTTGPGPVEITFAKDGMTFTFLKVDGCEMVRRRMMRKVRNCSLKSMSKLQKEGVELVLPVDFVARPSVARL